MPNQNNFRKNGFWLKWFYEQTEQFLSKLLAKGSSSCAKFCKNHSCINSCLQFNTICASIVYRCLHKNGYHCYLVHCCIQMNVYDNTETHSAGISRMRPIVLVALIFNTVSLNLTLLETSRETKVVQDSPEFSCPSPSLIVTNQRPSMRHATGHINKYNQQNADT